MRRDEAAMVRRGDEKHDGRAAQAVGDGGQRKQVEHLLLEETPLPEEGDGRVIVVHAVWRVADHKLRSRSVNPLSTSRFVLCIIPQSFVTVQSEATTKTGLQIFDQMSAMWDPSLLFELQQFATVAPRVKDTTTFHKTQHHDRKHHSLPVTSLSENIYEQRGNMQYE